MHPAIAVRDICLRKRFPMNSSRQSAINASPNSNHRDSSNSSGSDVRQEDDRKRSSVRALMALNFCIADVQNGMGPYIALFLQSWVGWGSAQIGTALAAGNLAQVIAQTPAGALNHQPLRPRPVDMDNRIGAYPEKGIPGTLLGPNRLGHPW